MVQLEQSVCFSYLEEALLDEKKIVTFKGLSRQMDVPFTKAIQEMGDFFEKKPSLFAVYFLSGKMKKSDLYKVSLVRGEDLEKAKRHFKTIASSHVYALLPNYPLDLSGVYAADSEGERMCLEEDLRHLKIQCLKAVKVDKPTLSVPEKASEQKAPETTKKSVKETVVETKEPTLTKTAPGKKVVDKKGKKAAGQLDTMFKNAKPAKKAEKKPAEVPKEPEKSGTEKKAAKKRSRVRLESDSGEDDIFSTNSTPEKAPIYSPRRSPRKHSSSPASPPKKSKAASSPKPTKKRSKKMVPPAEEDESNEEEEDVIPPTPPPVNTKAATVLKKKETVEQTMDEEGFMVVRKTTQTVSEPAPRPSKEEKKTKKKAEPSKKTTKAASGSGAKKQLGLSAFFKKP